MKKTAVLIILTLLVSFAFCESGQLHLVFANGSVTDNAYEFDVQAYMTDGSDVIGEGMIYVEYPEAVFNSVAVYNNKVFVELTGILAGSVDGTGLDRYSLVNVTDNTLNCFAVTFASTFNDMMPQYKSGYLPVSNDPANPSDLMHITMLTEADGSGEILFPASIPGLDHIFYDYEIENFDGGLDIAEALETVDMNTGDPVIDDPVVDDPVIDDPVDDPVFAGSVELASFTSSLKKGTAELKWSTAGESELSDFVVLRSSNGTDYSEIARVTAAGTTSKRQRYAAKDLNVIEGLKYSYRLVAVDVYGSEEIVSTIGLTSRKSKAMADNGIIDNDDMTLEASYPNPFNPSFTVPFTVHTPQTLDIRLYDMSGKVVAEVASGYHAAGSYKINVNCNDLGSGVYLLRTQLNGIDATQKMLLVK